MKRSCIGLILILLITSIGCSVSDTAEDFSIRPREERASILSELNLKRVDTLLLPAMRRNGIDCWIIMSREFNKDWVLNYIEDKAGATGGHRNAYIFFDDGTDRVRRLAIGTHLAAESKVWDQSISYHSGEGDEGPSLKPVLRKTIAELNPKKIAVNTSRTIPFCDGLTVAMKDFLTDAIGPEYAGRLVSAEALIVDFLDTRLPEEQQYFKEAAEISVMIHEEVFSHKAIHPGKTTVGQVRSYVYDRLAEMKLPTWYVPIIRVMRKGGVKSGSDTIIMPGDLIHTDIGVIYIGLYTDYQKNAYVLHPDETEAPEGLRNALQNSLRVQDAIFETARAGIPGYKVKDAAEKLCEEWGIRGRVYSHSTGMGGHGLGAWINPDWPDRYGARATFPLRPGAIYSIESSATSSIPEWEGQSIGMGTEEDCYMSETGLVYFLPRQEDLYLIGSTKE